ncbi:RNA-binding (RRM/RBD/RNP motifs) family protein [Striga asiatica]|uniref:RNA-binding (RRM/RBD/RNP motifs) family protein n=1 Tax=Striga asiatica TaxID=4170 RepID=A0A5A7PWW1_STRAF|nr:RNA-binding (RRM/RBD/RNP motifs) family protein [Striga asiatica]
MQGVVLDRSMLDSLYDAAMTQNNTNGTSLQMAGVPSNNPFESDDYSTQMFYDPSQPNQLQLAEIPQQQQTQQMIGYDYKQVIGIPQQQQETSLVVYDSNQQQEQSFVNKNLMQMTDTPLETPMQQQEKPIVAFEPMGNSRNPFD